jgi:hypothetical protein
MLGDAVELLFKIRADPAGVKSGMADARTSIVNGIEQIVKGSSGGLSNLSGSLSSVTSGLTSMGTAQQARQAQPWAVWLPVS